MKNRTLLTLSTFVGLAGLLTAPSSGQAQAYKPATTAKTVHSVDAHQVLAMAYRDNLVTFAKVLRGTDNAPGGTLPANNTPINKDVAKPAVDEMRRAFNKISDEQKEAGREIKRGTENDSAAKVLKNRMDSQLSELDNHLDALEKAVKESTPDARLIAQHTNEVLRQASNLWVLDARRGSGPSPK